VCGGYSVSVHISVTTFIHSENGKHNVHMCWLIGTNVLEETKGYPETAAAASYFTMLEYPSIRLRGTTSHNTVM
jgi:hypothetical protein